MVRRIGLVIGIVWFVCEFECAQTFQILRTCFPNTNNHPGFANITTGCHVCDVYNIFPCSNSTCFVVNCTRADTNRISESDFITRSGPDSSTTSEYNPTDSNDESSSKKFLEEAVDENLIEPTNIPQPPPYQIILGVNRTVETFENTRTNNRTRQICYQNAHAINKSVETYQNRRTTNQTKEIYQNRDFSADDETRNDSLSITGNNFAETSSGYQRVVEDTNNGGLLPFILSTLINATVLQRELQPPENSNEAVQRPNNQVYWSRRQTTTPSWDEYKRFKELLDENLKEYEIRAYLDGNSFKYSNDSVFEYRW